MVSMICGGRQELGPAEAWGGREEQSGIVSRTQGEEGSITGEAHFPRLARTCSHLGDTLPNGKQNESWHLTLPYWHLSPDFRHLSQQYLGRQVFDPT